MRDIQLVSEEEISQRVLTAVTEMLDIPESEIQLCTHLRVALGAYEFEIREIVAELEEEYDVDFSFEQIKEMLTPRHIIAEIEIALDTKEAFSSPQPNIHKNPNDLWRELRFNPNAETIRSDLL